MCLVSVYALIDLETLPSLFPCVASSSVYRSCILVACEVATDGGKVGLVVCEVATDGGKVGMT